MHKVFVFQQLVLGSSWFLALSAQESELLAAANLQRQNEANANKNMPLLKKGGFFCDFADKICKKYLTWVLQIDIIKKYHVCGLMVKRLRHRPFTAESGVRFPLRLP